MPNMRRKVRLNWDESEKPAPLAASVRDEPATRTSEGEARRWARLPLPGPPRLLRVRAVAASTAVAAPATVTAVTAIAARRHGIGAFARGSLTVTRLRVRLLHDFSPFV